MKNKSYKAKDLSTREYMDLRNRKEPLYGYTSLREDSIEDSEYSWRKKLFMKIFLTHKNKLIDRLIDIGCLLTIILVGGIAFFIAKWMFNLLQNLIY